jgi:iron complex outermembrane receptor protein
MSLLLPFYPKHNKEAALKNKRGVGFLIAMLGLGCVYAQHDSLVRCKQLAAVEVCALRDEKPNPALLQWKLRGSDDAALSGLSLADVLQRESAVFIKQYGPSMLATPSVRGTGAAHTALVWNGCNLQNGMNGQTDISLVPAFLFGSFTLQQGASSASWGSGAAGGALFLYASQQNEISLLQENGSFGHRLTALRVAMPFKKMRFSIGAFRLREENDFPYHNLAQADAPLIHQHNAQLEASGILASLSIETGKTGMLHFGSWAQRANRHIPPIMSVPMAKAYQADAALRNTINWSGRVAKWLIQLRGAWFEETLHYSDSLAHLHKDYSNRTLVQEAELAYPIHSTMKLSCGANQTLQYAQSEAYSETQKELRRQSVFAQWDAAFFENRLKLRSGLRKEWTSRADAPLIPFISSSIALLPQLTLNANYSGVYRIPTLNDLYWIPGGNPNLLPEQGQSAEAGLAWNTSIRKNTLSMRADVFHANIQNWILWVPGNAFWWPGNVKRVNNRGANFNSEFGLHIRQHGITLRTSLQMVSAEIVEAGDAFELHTSKQLIYVPRFTASGGLVWRHGTKRIELQYVHTGLRYTSSDNKQALPAFSLFNIIASKDIELQKYSVNLFLRWNNVFNAEYQIMLWRPMPMSHVQLGIQFNLHTHKS